MSSETTTLPGTAASGFKVMLLPLSASQLQCLNETSEVRARYWAVLRTVLECILPVYSSQAAIEPLLQARPRFSGYSPECALRAVRSLVELNAAEELYVLLKDQLVQHTHYAVTKLTQACVQPPAVVPDTTHSYHPNNNSNTLIDATRLSRSSASLHAFHSLTAFWHRYEATIKEMNMVWVYLNRWNVTRHGGTATLERLALTCLAEALRLHSHALLDLALDGFLITVQQDLRSCGSLSPTAQNGEQNEEEEEAVVETLGSGSSVFAAQSATQRRRAMLRCFTDLALAVQLYALRVQPLVLSAVTSYYSTSVWQLLEERHVSVITYFELAAAALQEERRRVIAYLHPHTLPALEEIAQRALLGTAGQDFLRRHFHLLMQPVHLDTLALVWRLFTTSAHSPAPGDFVTQLFRSYIEENSRRCLASFTSDTTNNNNSSTDAANITDNAGIGSPVRGRGQGMQSYAEVRALIAIVHHAEAAIERSFASARKEFTAALWETMESALALYPQPVSEQLASYLDAVLREAHRGTLPLRDTITSAVDIGEASSMDRAASREECEGRGRKRSRTVSRSASSEIVAEEEQEEEVVTAMLPQPEEEDVTMKSSEVNVADIAVTNDKKVPCAERVLRDIGTLFTHLPNKAIFEALYWRQLAHRLLVNSQRHAQHRTLTSDSEDFAEERLFIGILQDICGATFTAKYEGMLRDLQASRELNAQYAQWTNEGATGIDDVAQPTTIQEEKSEIDPWSAEEGTASHQPSTNTLPLTNVVQPANTIVDPQVQLFIFAGSLWPAYTSLKLILPTAWHALQERIERFYTQCASKRHLQWQHAVSTATLQATLPQEGTSNTITCELTGNTIQCAALLVLDEMLPPHSTSTATTVSLAALCSRLGMELQVPEVMASLCGLCHESCKLLLLESTETNTADESNNSTTTTSSSIIDSDANVPSSATHNTGPLKLQDRVRFNPAFRPATHRLRLPMQSRLKASDTSGEATSVLHERVAKEQNMQLDVALVSYMKSKGSAKYDTIMAEVASKVRFAVSPAAMKRALERMTTRGILMRKGADNYTYVP